MTDYKDGWKGITRTIYKEMWDTNTYMQPSWCRASTGLGFDASATLRANGLHPDFIPQVLYDDKYTAISNILKEVEKTIPLIIIPTPE